MKKKTNASKRTKVVGHVPNPLAVGTSPKTRPEHNHPKFVHERLTWYRAGISQDVTTLGQSRHRVAKNIQSKSVSGTLGDNLRSELLIPWAAKNKSPKACTTTTWHPFILDYCHTLGVDADAVDALYQMLVSGDLADENGVESCALKGLQQLDLAIAIALKQRQIGESVIHVDDPDRLQVNQEFSDYFSPKVWRSRFEKAGHSIAERTWTDFANKLRKRTPPDLKNHPKSGPKKVSIRQSLLTEMGIELP